MDLSSAEALLNPYVFAYLLIVILAQCWIVSRGRRRRAKIAKQRAAQDLPPDIIVDHAERLADVRRESLSEALFLVATIVLIPFVIVLLDRSVTGLMTPAEKGGLALVFLGLILWVLFNGTDLAKAFLGGLAFRTVLAFKNPIQVGDRVTLKGHGGKVKEIGVFFVKLQTPNDDLVSIPTRDLWSEVLVSANAGERSSLCVMNFYLAPFVSHPQRQAAEDVIWDTIQASPYLEPAKPMQIYLAQEPNAIRLTAKAYVASTYNEPLFVSDVTRAFLEFAAKRDIALASSAWKVEINHALPSA